MKRHNAFRHLLAERAGLAPAPAARLQAHLQECAECRELAAEYARQDAFLRTLPIPEPGPALRRGVFQRVAELPRPKYWRVPPRLLVFAPLAVVVLVLSTMLVRHGAGSKPAAMKPATHLVNGGRDHYQNPSFGSQAAASSHAPITIEAIPAAPLFPPLDASSGRFQSGRNTDGLRITLAIARNSYPLYALVPVHVTVQNLSPDPVQIEADRSFGCAEYRPSVAAIDDHGEVVEPLPVTGRPMPSCPMIPFNSPTYRLSLLGHGKTLDATLYTVLMTRHLRASMIVHRYHGCNPAAPGCRPHDSRAYGSLATIHLQPPDSPRAVLHGSPPTMMTLIGAPRNHRPLWVDGWFGCASPDRFHYITSEGGVGIEPAERGGTRVLLPLAGCYPPRTELHAVAGWLNHSVAFINYGAR